MIRKYHYHTLQTNPRLRDEEPHNTNSYQTSERHVELSNQISLPHQDYRKCNVLNSNTSTDQTQNNSITTEPLLTVA